MTSLFIGISVVAFLVLIVVAIDFFENRNSPRSSKTGGRLVKPHDKIRMGHHARLINAFVLYAHELEQIRWYEKFVELDEDQREKLKNEMNSDTRIEFQDSYNAYTKYYDYVVHGDELDKAIESALQSDQDAV